MLTSSLLLWLTAVLAAAPAGEKTFTPPAGKIWVGSGSSVEVSEATFFAFDARSIPFRRNLHLTMVPAEKHPTPVLPRGPRGSFDEVRAQYYGTVLRIDGKFRMWYCGRGFHDPHERTIATRSSLVGYAESPDGIHWTKPNLGLVEYHGNRANNIVAIEPVHPYIINLHVLYKPQDPDPGRRFKMMIYIPYEGGGSTLMPLLSSDGLRWRYAVAAEFTEEARPRIRQSSMVFPPEHLEGGSLVKVGGTYYQNGQQTLLQDGTRTGRVTSTFWSSDFVHWHPEKALSLVRWGFDFFNPATYGVGEDRYVGLGEQAHEGAALWNRGNVLVGLYGLWHGGKRWRDRRLDLGLVTTTDAIHFTEPEPGFRFAIAGRPGEWDQAGLLQGQGFENVGDRTYIWYGNWNLAANPEEEIERATLIPQGGVGLLKLRRDGFGYLSVLDPKTASARETYRSGVGSLLTAPFRVTGNPATLFLNVDVSGRGTLTVEVLDEAGSPVPGYSSAEFIPLQQSGVREPARWKQHRTLPGQGSYRLRVSFDRKGEQSPRLYAIYVSADHLSRR